MNNPMQMLRAMSNPQNLLNMMIQNSKGSNNPIINKTMDLYRNGDTQGLRNMAENLCKEYGTTPEQVMNDVRSQFKF